MERQKAKRKIVLNYENKMIAKVDSQFVKVVDNYSQLMNLLKTSKTLV